MICICFCASVPSVVLSAVPSAVLPAKRMFDASIACCVIMFVSSPLLMYIVFVVFVFCWLCAQSTCFTCQMEDNNPADVTVASILAHLQDVTSRDESAEKLYRLAQALESQPSRERRTVLRRLSSGTEWNISLRADGKSKTMPVLEQELKTAATRAYVALRARENASLCGAGVERSAQPPRTEETHSIATQRAATDGDASQRAAGVEGSAQTIGTNGTEDIATQDGDASQRANQFMNPPAVMYTAPAVQGESRLGKRQAEKNDDLPHNNDGFSNAALHLGINEKARGRLALFLLLGRGIVVEASVVFLAASVQRGAASA